MNRRNRGSPGSAQSAAARKELKYYGSAACLALWQRRPQDIIRIYLEEDAIPRFGAMLKWAADKRRAYHVVSADDLERLTQSIHHQGICVLAKEHAALSFTEWLPLLRDDAAARLLVYLDGVENPHNLGAILRSCAHFGIRYVLGAAKRLPKLSPAACRVAEGGAEHVMLVHLQQPLPQLERLRQSGVEFIATAAGKGLPLYRHRFSRRSLLILGNEGEGITPALLQNADKVLHIPGSGEVESLNVSVACAVIAAEHYRQLHAGPAAGSGGAPRRT